MKIIIIKLGAKGDVVRTLPVLKAIKEKHPDSVINWVTKENSKDLFKNNEHVDKVFSIEDLNAEEKFFEELNKDADKVYNFDIEEDATALAKKIDAKEKLGFSSEEGFAIPFNFAAEYYLNTIFDDELKKNNKKTYQEMMFDAAELPYDKEHYGITLSDDELDYAKEFFENNDLDNENPTIGIHLGASSRWPSKVWHNDNIKEFIRQAKLEGFDILVFGGPEESEKLNEFKDELANDDIEIIINDPNNSDRNFFSLVNLVDYMLVSDSFSLHVAISLKKPTVSLFFVTSPDEVEGYDYLEKIASPKLDDFFPEKQDLYDEDLTRSITPEEVLDRFREMRIKDESKKKPKTTSKPKPKKKSSPKKITTSKTKSKPLSKTNAKAKENKKKISKK